MPRLLPLQRHQPGFFVQSANFGFDSSPTVALDPATADLALIEIRQGFRLLPASVPGLVWLQTHFESGSWPALAAGEVRLDVASSEQLAGDAGDAGLRVARIGLGLPSPTAAVATEWQPGPG